MDRVTSGNKINDVDLLDFCDEFANFKESLSFFVESSSCLLEKSLEDEVDISVIVGLWRFGRQLNVEVVRLQGLLDVVRKVENN